VSKVNVRFQRPGTISRSGQFTFHGKGLLVYGLPTPQSDKGIELSNVAQVLPGRNDPSTDRENGMFRQTDINVIRNDSFEIRLQTRPVKLLGSNDLRDVDADGDQALLRVDGGRDINGNGVVDFRTPGTTEYGFERFTTKSRPLIANHDPRAPRGDGEFRQTINATRLEEGVHFVTVRAYRHQPPGRPAVFTDFKTVIYVDRKPPESSFERFGPADGGPQEVWIRSSDLTADAVHVFANVAAGATDAQIIAMTGNGGGRLDRIDRGLFKGSIQNLHPGPNVLTIVTFERTGNRRIQRVNQTLP
jgi:hypothetical protein